MSGPPRLPDHDRQRAERRGRRAEITATWLLRLKGYRLLSRRYRCAVGEIDLLARRGGLLIAVEVKARDNLDDAAYAIDRRQRERISRATEHFLAANPHYGNHDVRFDAVLVAPGKWPRHVPDAWRIE